MHRPLVPLLFALLVLAPSAAPAEGEGGSPVPDTPPEFRIYLDPGHGGRPERASRVGGAHWDPLQGKFLNVYRFGAEFREAGGVVVSEQAQVLRLAKLVRERLEWTHTEAGWKRFEGLLSRFGGVLPPFHRLRFQVRLSRENDYETHPSATTKNGRRRVNKYFRIFDSPDQYPHKPGAPLRPGRLSESAAFSPHLQVSMHIDGSVDPKARGMSALFVPSPADFELGRKIILGKIQGTQVPKVPKLLQRYWSYRGPERSKLGWLLNDTWTYFTGYGATSSCKGPDAGSFIGQRWQHVAWAYADAVEAQPRTTLAGSFGGPFFEREASPYEAARRAQGPEEVGGDNLYAGQELLRYIRMAWWKHHQGGAKAWDAGLTPKGLLPPLEKPTGADWAMPLFTNAVAPYLELGQLWNAKDRFLLTEWLEPAADGLAVGLYSLAAGFQVPPAEDVEAPRGLPIDWERYRMPDGKSYFEASHPRFQTRQIAGPPAAAGEGGKGS